MTAPTSACPRCSSPLEPGDLRCSICALAVPAPAPAGTGAASPAAVARILRCRECAAAVSYVAEAGAPRCGFCGAVMEVEEPTDPIEQPEWMLPFRVERDQARAALRRWMRSLGWFRPRDLSSAATIESIRPLHFAAWICDADASVTWAADSNAGSGRSAWAPHAGTASFTWRNILVSASRGLSLREASRLAPDFRLDTAIALTRPGEPGAALERNGAIESFDAQRSAARRRVVAAIEDIAEAELTRKGHIPGDRFRNVHSSVLLSKLTTRRYVLPAWVLAYRYKGGLYRSVVHGQDASNTFGTAPRSWLKIGLAAAVALAVLALVLVAVLSTHG